MTTTLIYLTLVVVFLIDFSGIVDTLKDALGKWLKVRITSLKPFDCSLCMTWWCGLLAILIGREFTLGNILLVAMLALFTDKIADTIRLVRDLISKAINKLYELLNL